MNEKDIVKEVMTLRKWSQSKLAEEAGFKSQSNVTGILNRGKNGVRVDHLVKMLNAMGCDVVVRDRTDSKNEWVIVPQDERDE